MSTTTTKTYRVSDFDVVRDMPLPAGTIRQQVEAVQAYYRRCAGSGLERGGVFAAIDLLDQILADRSERPSPKLPRSVPAKYRAITDYLASEDYPREWILVCIRQLEKYGTAIGLESIEEGHQDEVERLWAEIQGKDGGSL